MAAPWQSLIQKTETALDATVTALSISGYASLKGSDDSEKTSPSVVSAVQSVGEEDPIGTGNFHINAAVTVNTQAHSKTALTTHQSTCGTVFDKLTQDTVAATLSAAAADFHAIAVLQQGFESNNDETEFSDSIMLDIYCCARDL